MFKSLHLPFGVGGSASVSNRAAKRAASPEATLATVTSAATSVTDTNVTVTSSPVIKASEQSPTLPPSEDELQETEIPETVVAQHSDLPKDITISPIVGGVEDVECV